jgi:hypothetical protein
MPKAKAEALRAAAMETAPDLCRSLVCIAALHVEDPEAQMKVYAAVKTISILAGLAPMPPLK